MALSPSAVSRAVARLPRDARSSAREQVVVAGAQVVSGVGNLAFALAAARILAPGEFARLAGFLALYLLIHLPTASLSAGAAVAPGSAARLRHRTAAAGGVVGLALLAMVTPLGALLHLPAPLLAVVAVTPPIAGLLALERGRLYATGLHRRAAASLAVEPLVRLALGLPLLVAAGTMGAAVGVVAGGAAALGVAAWRSPHDPRRRPELGQEGAEQGLASHFAPTVLAFLLLALLQQQDVLLANRLLGAREAGAFAVVSTLGSSAAHVMATLPNVLLPRAARQVRGALPVAIGLAATLGAGAVAAAAVAPSAVVSALFGAGYDSAGPLLVPYTAAMALLGVSRVLTAQRCATGAAGSAVGLPAGAAALQLALLLTMARDARGVVHATLLAACALAIATALSLRANQDRS